MNANELTPVEPPYTSDVGAMLAKYPRAGDEILTLFRVFARSERFLGGKGVVNLLDRDSPLALAERELVILRVTANFGCEYEWGVHVTGFAKVAGFDDDQVSATCRREIETSRWSSEQVLLLQVVDALCDNAVLPAELQDAFSRAFDVDAQLEIMALVGNYHTISCVARVAGLSPEPWAARFP